VTNDRQTDHATEKCVAIGGITCTARAIPPNNDNNEQQQENDTDEMMTTMMMMMTMMIYLS